MICPYCRTEVPAGLRYCTNCGADLSASPCASGDVSGAGAASSESAYAAPQFQPGAGKPFGPSPQGAASSGVPERPGAQPAQRDSNAPLVLGIIGVILCFTGLWFAGLVLCIIGLVLTGKLSPRNQTAPKVLNIVGIVLSGICLAITLLIGGLIVGMMPYGLEDVFDATYATAPSRSIDAAFGGSVQPDLSAADCLCR